MKIKNKILATSLSFLAMTSPLMANSSVPVNYVSSEMLSSVEDKEMYFFVIESDWDEASIASELEYLNGFSSQKVFLRKKVYGNFYSVVVRGDKNSDYKSFLENLSFVSSVDYDVVIKPSSFTLEPRYSEQLYMLSQSVMDGYSSVAYVRDLTEMPSRLPTSSNDREIIDQRPTVAILDTGIISHDSVYEANIIDGYKFSSIYDPTVVTENLQAQRFRDVNNVSQFTPYFQSGSNYTDYAHYIMRTQIDESTVIEEGPLTCIDSHGTGVAGLIAAPINGDGLAGIADVNLVIAKVMDTDCSSLNLGTQGLVSDLATAIRWSAGDETIPDVSRVDKIADVISINSTGFSGVSCPAVLQTAIDYALVNGSIVVTSAGNDNQSASQSIPSNCEGVIVVSSNDEAGLKSTFSNYGGNYVDFSVLGEDIVFPSLSAESDVSNYANVDGTTQSAAIFAGMASLLKYNFEMIDPISLEEVVRETALDFSDSQCLNNRCGSGIVNLEAAYDEIELKLNYGLTTSNYFGAEVEGSCGDFTQQAMAEYVDICSLYSIEISNPAEESGFSYKLFRKAKGNGHWNFNDSIRRNVEELEEYEVTDTNVSETKNIYLRDLDLDTYDYGVGYCSESFCYPLKDLGIESIPESDLPLSCR